jgi:hypothetical protein
MINYLALLVALVVSGVSAYFSIIGLTAIFAAAFWPIIIMGATLEVGKLVTTSWLYRNWSHSPIFLKVYLSIAVVILMFITSMGTFGFLSKAHIEQSINITTGTADQVQVILARIENEKANVADVEKQIAQIDAALSKMTEKGQAANSLQAADKQRKTRDELVKKKDAYNKTIGDLTVERVKLQSEVKKMEAEVGPLKYIAEMIYDGSAGTDILEKAVRMVILTIIFVFDPLAVVLLLAANHGLAQRNNLTNEQKPSILETLEIDDTVLNLGENNVVER